jgi:hypothetical protein
MTNLAQMLDLKGRKEWGHLEGGGANALPFALAFLVPFNPLDAARELSQAETALAGLSL